MTDVKNLDYLVTLEKHRCRVAGHILALVSDLLNRAKEHDYSKTVDPEATGFISGALHLRDLHYNSKEYQDGLERLGPVLKHHYEMNRHHPQHFENGLAGMTLVDIIEMFCDWMASTERQLDGDVSESMKVNAERFGLTQPLMSIFINTALEYHMGQGVEKLHGSTEDPTKAQCQTN